MTPEEISATIDELSSGPMIAALRKRGYTVWPTNRVVNEIDCWVVAKTPHEFKGQAPKKRPKAPKEQWHAPKKERVERVRHVDPMPGLFDGVERRLP